MYSAASVLGAVVNETVPLVGLIWIRRLVGAEHPHFSRSFVIAMLIFGSSFEASGSGAGVVRVAYIRLLAIVAFFGGTTLAFSLLPLAGVALVSSGALVSLVCFGLGFFGGVGPCITDLFLPFAGVSGGCAAASAYDFVCWHCNMLTCRVAFAAKAATFVNRSLV